jgi:hypothetical protein
MSIKLSSFWNCLSKDGIESEIDSKYLQEKNKKHKNIMRTLNFLSLYYVTSRSLYISPLSYLWVFLRKIFSTSRQRWPLHL